MVAPEAQTVAVAPWPWGRPALACHRPDMGRHGMENAQNRLFLGNIWKLWFWSFLMNICHIFKKRTRSSSTSYATFVVTINGHLTSSTPSQHFQNMEHRCCEPPGHLPCRPPNAILPVPRRLGPWPAPAGSLHQRSLGPLAPPASLWRSSAQSTPDVAWCCGWDRCDGWCRPNGTPPRPAGWWPSAACRRSAWTRPGRGWSYQNLWPNTREQGKPYLCIPKPSRDM